jgi:hypothetical protein
MTARCYSREIEAKVKDACFELRTFLDKTAQTVDNKIIKCLQAVLSAIREDGIDLSDLNERRFLKLKLLEYLYPDEFILRKSGTNWVRFNMLHNLLMI